MATYKILYWYDIPTQVRAEDENGRVSVQLPERFQLAIDEAAMAAKMVGDDDYTRGFRWDEERTRDGTAKEVAQAIAEELAEQNPEIDWRTMVNNILMEKERKSRK